MERAKGNSPLPADLDSNRESDLHMNVDDQGRRLVSGFFAPVRGRSVIAGAAMLPQAERSLYRLIIPIALRGPRR